MIHVKKWVDRYSHIRCYEDLGRWCSTVHLPGYKNKPDPDDGHKQTVGKQRNEIISAWYKKGTRLVDNINERGENDQRQKSSNPEQCRVQTGVSSCQGQIHHDRTKNPGEDNHAH
eukprot:TRINITY_DN5896_c0_g1_i1.p3 TRINITY_DN5896_c0_g1~~TRINITY_DN5896_c0_g1_i1.p3  ORF type:complete len:115 (-),score=2.44 TRINITY_DN5896_c0_g1_i1:265-609(-)